MQEHDVRLSKEIVRDFKESQMRSAKIVLQCQLETEFSSGGTHREGS
jgi:hypothetical protein